MFLLKVLLKVLFKKRFFDVCVILLILIFFITVNGSNSLVHQKKVQTSPLSFKLVPESAPLFKMVTKTKTEETESKTVIEIENPTIQQVVDRVWEDELAACEIYQKIFESNQLYKFSDFFSICEEHDLPICDDQNKSTLTKISQYKIEFENNNKLFLLNDEFDPNNFITFHQQDINSDTKRKTSMQDVDIPKLSDHNNFKLVVQKTTTKSLFILKEFVDIKMQIFSSDGQLIQEIQNGKEENDKRIFIQFKNNIYFTKDHNNNKKFFISKSKDDVFKYWIYQNQQNQEILQTETEYPSSSQKVVSYQLQPDSTKQHIEFIIYKNIDKNDKSKIIEFIPTIMEDVNNSKFLSITPPVKHE